MAGRRTDGALRDVGDHRSAERVAQRDGNPLAKQLDAPIVFSERHGRAVLLGSADGHDDGGFARGDCVAQLRPSEILEEN